MQSFFMKREFCSGLVHEKSCQRVNKKDSYKKKGFIYDT